jgi:acyl-CoA thioesterase-1
MFGKTLSAFLLALVLHAAHAAATPVILVFGDSLSAAYGMRADQGWVKLLEKKLAAEGYGYRVVNASVSGETSGGGRARFKHALDVHRPSIVILELGGNDGLRGLPPAQMRANLEAMIKDARTAKAQVLLVGMRIPTNYGPVYSRQFETVFADLAHQYRLAFVPFLLEGVALNASLMQPDGIHPTVAAQARLLNTLWSRLHRLLKKP